METQDASGSEDCPFCQIADNHTDTEILLSDDELLCFRDIQPGATHHYLVVPRTHIDNCKCLQGDDIPMVERMVEMGWSILKKTKDGVSCASVLIRSPPPPPRSGSSQRDELQVAATIRSPDSLVHHSRQSAFSVEDSRQSEMMKSLLLY